MKDLKMLTDSVIKGEERKTTELVQRAIEEGLPPGKILTEGLIPGMKVVGERMKNYEMYLPEVFLSARVMQAGIDLLQSLNKDKADKIELLAKVVLGTVKGDLHDIGKNLVRMMLTGAGLEVIDLGIDVPPEKFVQVVKEEGPQVLGLSALLTTTMSEMETTIEALAGAGIREKVKVIVGGAPISLQYAQQIGADGYAEDAARAVDVVKDFVKPQ